MIVTPDGTRMLGGVTRDLYRGAIGTMLDWLVTECRGETGPWTYGIDWFDQWEPYQRIWLIEVVAKSLLTTTPPPPRWAIFEATLDAIAAELRGLVQLEINGEDVSRPGNSGALGDSGIPASEPQTWRQQLVAAAVGEVEIDPGSTDMSSWHRIIGRVADRVTGPLSYIDIERFRDGDPVAVQAYLRRRGLPEDYLVAIPPMLSVDRAQLSIDRIQTLVFETS